MKHRHDRNTKGRLRVHIGLLAGAIFILAGMTLAVSAGEISPGVVIIANHDAGEHGTWQCRTKLMGALDAPASIDEYEGIVFAPRTYTTAPTGGAATLNVTRPGFHVITAPTAGAIVSTLRFEIGGTVTAFAMQPIRFRFDDDSDRLRFGPFSNTGGGAVTLTAAAEDDGIMTAIVYGADGNPVETFYLELAGKEIVQAKYSAPLDAFTVQLVPGCIGAGPCGGAVGSYVIATNTVPAAATQTIEVAYGESVTPASLSQIVSEMALVALHPPDLTKLAKRRAVTTPAELARQLWVADRATKTAK